MYRKEGVKQGKVIIEGGKNKGGGENIFRACVSFD